MIADQSTKIWNTEHKGNKSAASINEKTLDCLEDVVYARCMDMLSIAPVIQSNIKKIPETCLGDQLDSCRMVPGRRGRCQPFIPSQKLLTLEKNDELCGLLSSPSFSNSRSRSF